MAEERERLIQITSAGNGIALALTNKGRLFQLEIPAIATDDYTWQEIDLIEDFDYAKQIESLK